MNKKNDFFLYNGAYDYSNASKSIDYGFCIKSIEIRDIDKDNKAEISLVYFFGNKSNYTLTYFLLKNVKNTQLKKILIKLIINSLLF